MNSSIENLDVELALSVEEAIKFNVPMEHLVVIGLDGRPYTPEKVIKLYEGGDRLVYRFQTVLFEDLPLEKQSLFIRKAPEDIIFSTISEREIITSHALDCLFEFQTSVNWEKDFLAEEHKSRISSIIEFLQEKLTKIRKNNATN